MALKDRLPSPFARYKQSRPNLLRNLATFDRVEKKFESFASIGQAELRYADPLACRQGDS